MITREALVATVRQHIGTRWHHQGRTPGVGLDCIGLFVVSATELGAILQDFQQYGPIPRPEILMAQVTRHLVEVPLDERQVGDLLCFAAPESGKPSHFGVLVERAPDRMVHAFAKHRRVALEPVADQWVAALHSVWKLREFG